MHSVIDLLVIMAVAIVPDKDIFECKRWCRQYGLLAAQMVYRLAIADVESKPWIVQMMGPPCIWTYC